MYTRMSSCTKTLSTGDQSDKTNLTIYIGDSVGDLLCLLEADIGVVIASSSSLGKIATHFGVSFVPLFSALIKSLKNPAQAPIMFFS
ncbi:putative HAD superfamily protein [Helianthus debilis subsp. tardiflorus]